MTSAMRDHYDFSDSKPNPYAKHQPANRSKMSPGRHTLESTYPLPEVGHMPRKPKRDSAGAKQASVRTVAYPARRKNIPPAGLEAQGMVRDEPPVQLRYNAHLPPVLRSAADVEAADRLPELLAAVRERALTADEAAALGAAVGQHQPWLEWSGKHEKSAFEVDPVPLHMHERVATEAILQVLAREDVNRDLFADPQHDYAKAVQFYRHDVDWANRMILGDSAQVMASLARREDLAGKVQMIYLDPPYGIRFRSNFQPNLGQRDVKDSEQDLARQPEVVQAYRDTWLRGVHSYLAYLRDRLTLARELLADTGSIFVQISDENQHRVRCLMDEVFGEENAIVTIVFKKKGATTPTAAVHDYLLWYAKDRGKAKVIPLAEERSDPEDDGKFRALISPDGEVRRAGSADETARLLGEGFRWARIDYPIVSQHPHETRSADYLFEGRKRKCAANRQWSFDVPAGLDRLAKSERLFSGGGDSIGGVVYWEDRGSSAIANLWVDTKGEASPIYAVQTAWKVVQRCLLMTTDPGDLVLDPTCGSGTTAFVAEQWARRWIVIDTSRVALALAKHRLMTAEFDYYDLRELTAEDLARNPGGVWIADEQRKKPLTLRGKQVPRIVLNSSIAQNTSLDPVFAKHEPELAEKLASLNGALGDVDDKLKSALVEKLILKHRQQGANGITNADIRRWLLPDAPANSIKYTPARGGSKAVTERQAANYRQRIPQGRWQEWEVPFDADPDWPSSLRDALAAYRAARRDKMEEVERCIAANAESEELVDRPEVVRGIVRVSGPFTMEGVIAVETGLDSPIGGAPEALEVFDAPAGDMALANAEAHLAKVIRLLKVAGVDFPGNKSVGFARLDATMGSLVHAEGTWANGNGDDRRVAVSIGPEGGNLSVLQVEEAIRDANRAGYDDLVFAAFGFDAAAQEAVEDASHPKLRLHMALIRFDVKMGDDLLKDLSTSQLFTVFSAPRMKEPQPQPDGQFVVEVEGMDVYDPASGAVSPTDSRQIAAWFLDTDYDGRTFCICQAFFPDPSKWDKLAQVLGDNGVVEREAFGQLSGLSSLPFARPARLTEGETWRIAVKMIDPRGNEGLRVRTIAEAA